MPLAHDLTVFKVLSALFQYSPGDSIILAGLVFKPSAIISTVFNDPVIGVDVFV